jgi:hypothetical protein
MRQPISEIHDPVADRFSGLCLVDCGHYIPKQPLTADELAPHVTDGFVTTTKVTFRGSAGRSA